MRWLTLRVLDELDGVDGAERQDERCSGESQSIRPYHLPNRRGEGFNDVLSGARNRGAFVAIPGARSISASMASGGRCEAAR